MTYHRRDMSSPRPLILIHIPKTAGTTLSHMLRLHFGLSPANWLRHARALGFYHLGYARPEHLDARFARIEALTPAQRRGVRFFAAHAGYGLRERLPAGMRDRAAYLTVLREPVARVISTFHHLRAEGRLASDATLRQYVDQRRHFGLFKFDNCQTRYLAGEGGTALDAPCGEVTRENLELAKSRLEHDLLWFGLTERFDDSVLLLADAIGWKRPRYVPARVTRAADRDAPKAEDDLLREIRELNDLDIELHAHARRLFEQRIGAQGPAFATRREQFQRDNARYARRLAPVNALLPRARALMQRAGLLR